MNITPRVLVLVVEDEVIIRFLAAENLEDAGYDVVEAACASDALAILNSRGDVGVLFTDVNMPGEVDGMDLAEMVHGRWPEIKLVVTSGREQKRDVPDDGLFLRKPYSADEMTASIRAASGL